MIVDVRLTATMQSVMYEGAGERMPGITFDIRMQIVSVDHCRLDG